ncbi:glycosyltransferase family 4 protein [Flavilitoribacter nigricans]|uniref:Glycosyl transferase family 1 domain-containing protein n=1 Tax=Flavilitoribacter nigricans (strain ATCC 23147 / DSM 23189 / NBRC 102662 / NCIMB 1420 / SS-2) TaxID=1122177 RepID=A0A2D0NJM3_FLAN2|nr:glycosyltransferase family 4 protein [Flavilitoribacter nigricans]PHN08590.1 hypothetical protein CRP01_01375 [Flavilitoribacter nigricans DSM 23189 = NBRC 102662]
MLSRRKVILVGPPTGREISGAYGGGTGGYTRKMQLYLNHFRSDRFVQVPCFHSVRGQSFTLGLAGRFLHDLSGFARALFRTRAGAVHMLGQYRGATPREFGMTLLALLFRRPYLYEIKAGVFIDWYGHTNPLNRFMIRFVLKKATVVLAQGKPYIDFLATELGIPAVYFPNFVAAAEMIPHRRPSLDVLPVRILFIGYAFEEKGTGELVTACRQMAADYRIQLTTIGAEHPDFRTWADQLSPIKNFTWIRTGKLPHPKVLGQLSENDIYCYPTRHPGEGHNNTINEAMMSGLVVVTTRQGFLASIVGADRGYLLADGSSAAIIAAIHEIMNDKTEAIRRTKNARQYLETHFVDTIAFRKLENAYAKMLPE